MSPFLPEQYQSLDRWMLAKILLVITLAGCGSSKKEPNTYEANELLLVRTLGQGQTAYLSVAFPPSGEAVAACTIDGFIHAWDLTTANSPLERKAADVSVTAISYSVDGVLFASGDRDGIVKLWRASSLTLLAVFRNGNAPIRTVAFSPDGSKLASATGSPEGVVRVWDLSTGEGVVAYRQADSRFANESVSNIKQFAYSPDGTLFGVAMRTGVVLCEVADRSEKWFMPSASTKCFSFSPSGTRIAVGSSRRVRVWALGASLEEIELPITVDPDCEVISIAFYPDERFLAVGLTTGPDLKSCVQVWDLQTCSVLQSAYCHSDSLTELALAADGRILATAAYDGYIGLWSSKRLSRNLILP